MRDGAERDHRDVRTRLDTARSALRSEVDRVGVLGRDLSAQEILDLPRPGECLVAPLITPRGGAMFVIPSGTETISEANILSLDTPELYQMLHPAQPVYDPEAAADLSEWLHWNGVWRSDTARETKENREYAMERLLGALWNGLMEPVHKLAAACAAETLLILPQGGLQLLPLHAAFRVQNGEKRYLLDDFVIQYAPSAWVLRRCRQVADAHGSEQRALCVAVKRYQDFLRLRPLPFSHVEAGEVARMTGAEVLLDREASASRIVREVSEFTQVHFACHATTSGDPLAVALQLGGSGVASRDELPVRRIIAEMDLSRTRLITLAACESGVVEHLHSADEYVGLPGALLQAGAVAVISSLFVVHDLASCLFWRAFYDFCWTRWIVPAAALRAAQVWLRDLTSGELRRIAGSWRAENPEAAEEALHIAHSERPFSHPLLWSGFVYVGA